MAIDVGSNLLHYRITAKLGEGGMGEVWRAEDTKLGRSVALKLLPESTAADPERLERFRREATAVAALNHPNIVTLYAVEEADGVPFLTMELVEGTTLRQRIPPGGAPLPELFELATPIADALAAAHEKGITHRDLKPDNVMVDGKGRVKVLDFGLAKVGDVFVAAPEAKTATAPLTWDGRLLGTVAYMSPEQAQGKPVDRRSDVFSLGVLLYEMATGYRPFGGENAASVITSLLRDTPAPVTEVKAGLPRQLERIIRRCLEKDPERRFDSAKALRLELEDLAKEVAAGVSEEEPVPRRAEEELARTRRESARRLAVASFLGLLAAILLILLILSRSRNAPPVPVSPGRFASTLSPPEGCTFNAVDGPPALTRDGRKLAFLAAEDDGTTHLFVRSLDQLEARRLDGTANAKMPFWSPDGESLGFFSDGKLKRVDLAGGLPLALDDAPDPAGGSWSSQGKILYVADVHEPPWLIDASGGTSRRLPEPYPDRHTPWYYWPQFLGDGEHFVFVLEDTGGPESGIQLASLSDPGMARRLTRTVSKVSYVEPGWLLWWEEGALTAARLDPERLELKAERVLVAGEVALGQYYVYGRFAVSQNGVLVYHQGEEPFGDTTLVRVDRSGGRRTVLEERAEYYSPRLAADGNRIAVDMTDVQTTFGDVWVLDPERKTSLRLTRDALDESSPVWTADDKEIFFMRVPNILRRDVEAAQPARIVYESERSTRPDDLSPDGRHLLIRLESPDNGLDVWDVDPESGEARPWLAEAYNEANARFSPDGRWVAYQSDESGRYEVSVRSFPDGKRRRVIVSSEGGETPVWRRDGRELFYYSAAGEITAVAVDWSGGIPVFGKPRPLFAARLRVEKTEFDVYPDGESFLLNERIPDTDEAPLVLVQGWDSVLPPD